MSFARFFFFVMIPKGFCRTWWNVEDGRRTAQRKREGFSLVTLLAVDTVDKVEINLTHHYFFNVWDVKGV